MESSIWESGTDVGIFSPGGGGGGGYDAVEFLALGRDPLNCDSSPHILLHALLGMGGSPIRSLSASSPAVFARCCMSSFISALITLPIRRILLSSHPGTRLAETLSSTSLHVYSYINKLWRAAHLSGFGTACRNSAKSLSDSVLF